MLVDHIVVSQESIRNSDVYAVIESNISVVNYLLEEGAEPGELSPDALGSYYVDYYVAEVMNGGISQFMFNCGGDHQVLDHITRALPLLGATGHAELFSEVRARWEAKEAEEQRAFLDGGLFESADPFEELSDRFSELNGAEDLIELNAAFIRNHPTVEAVRLEHLEAHLAGIWRPGSRSGNDSPRRTNPATRASSMSSAMNREWNWSALLPGIRASSTRARNGWPGTSSPVGDTTRW